MSRPSFFAFDGGAQLCGGDYSSFGSDEGIRSFSGKTLDGESQAIRTNMDGAIQPGLLPAKKFYGFIFPDRPWFSVALTFFLVCVAGLLIGATQTPWLALTLARAQTASAIMAGWIFAGVLLRSAMLERSEALSSVSPSRHSLFGVRTCWRGFGCPLPMRPKKEALSSRLRKIGFSKKEFSAQVELASDSRLGHRLCALFYGRGSSISNHRTTTSMLPSRHHWRLPRRAYPNSRKVSGTPAARFIIIWRALSPLFRAATSMVFDFCPSFFRAPRRRCSGRWPGN